MKLAESEESTFDNRGSRPPNFHVCVAVAPLSKGPVRYLTENRNKAGCKLLEPSDLACIYRINVIFARTAALFRLLVSPEFRSDWAVMQRCNLHCSLRNIIKLGVDVRSRWDGASCELERCGKVSK